MARCRFRVLLEWDAEDSVWVTYVPSLANLSTFSDTRDEALAMTKEAIIGYIEAAIKEGLPVPSADSPAELVEIEVSVP